MKVKFLAQDEFKKKLLEIMGKYVDLHQYKVFFFGSRVKGTNTERSDIDIGILGPVPLSAKTKFIIEEEIEKFPTLYKLELVDFNNVADSFKKEAMKSTEFLN